MNVSDPMATFTDATRAWFAEAFDGATPPQTQAWPAIADGAHTLVAAPTGSGKTLAAFLTAIDRLVARALAGELQDQTSVLYISPLKALGNDVEKNLVAPLAGILAAAGLPDGTITTAVRSGDTPPSRRRAQLDRPAHIFVTTPESLYILLTTERGRAMLETVETVIVDEVHAVVGDKRGSHLALSIERLDALVGGGLQRIGLSATQRPIDAVARFLVGDRTRDGGADCVVIDAGHRRAMDIQVEVPDSPLSAVMSSEVWTEVHRRLASLIEGHRTTLIFVNTRRLAERLTAALEELIGVDAVMSHHGSLSRKHRHVAEQRLKRGELKALVATASLELGIDIGDVDLVCQMGTTRTIAAFLQRVGRSGHGVGRTPKGRMFPLTRDELVEAAALMHAVQADQLDRLIIPDAPLDILAQQMVAEVAAGPRSEAELVAMCRRAWPFRGVDDETMEELIAMLSDGFATARGRRGAYLHRDAVNRQLRPRRSARLTAITSGGAIPDIADYDVVLESSGHRVGSLDEDFAIESMVGDVFRLGDASWQILKVEPGKVFVRDASGMPPSIPFWFGEAPSRSQELSQAVGEVREALSERSGGDVDRAAAWARDACGLTAAAAHQLAEYVLAGVAALGGAPTQDRVVLERFFDESGGMQLVLHAPFGARVNRGWGLALRKRFCRRFNFELQAAATEDAVLLSLGVTHSFPLDEVFSYLSAATVRDVLVQALLDAPMFGTRWRWNANRALAVPRFRGGKRVPPAIQRMHAEDLVSVVFPDQIACLENLSGPREVPEHPLVRQTIRDCLEEAMDIDALQVVLTRIAEGTLETHAVDLTEPSPFAAEIINASPYAFLDDAPLEERRTNAVRGRRHMDPESAKALGTLDAAAAGAVADQAWPVVRDAEELHDALVVAGSLAPDQDVAVVAEGPASALIRDAWGPWFDALAGAGRAVEVDVGAARLWVAVERLCEVRAAFEAPTLGSPVDIPAAVRVDATRESGALELVRGRLEISGALRAVDLTQRLGLSAARVNAALLALEGEGFALRGGFLGDGERWCERRILARIHRRTLDAMRSRVRPVTPVALTRWTLANQHVAAGERLAGVEGVAAVIAQLQGVAVPAAAWEAHVLPARVDAYDPSMLDALCFSGRVCWARAPRKTGSGGAGPVRTTPIVLMPRATAHLWRVDDTEVTLGSEATRVRDALAAGGALFFDELCRAARLLPAQTERALGELVAAGVAVSDGFGGLRALITPADLKRRGGRGGRGSRSAPTPIASAGRWSLVADVGDTPEDELAGLIGVDSRTPELTEILLDRHGVLFRAIVAREQGLPPWRDFLRVLRRMEARGEVRGGRFVSGFSGEQYARSATVSGLRGFREMPESPETVSLSAVDPANPLGGLQRSASLVSVTGNRVLLRGGEVVAVRDAAGVRFVGEVAPDEKWAVESALVRVSTPPAVRSYLGNRA